MAKIGKRQFAIIGLGKFGLKLAEYVAQEGVPLVVIDNRNRPTMTPRMAS